MRKPDYKAKRHLMQVCWEIMTTDEMQSRYDHIGIGVSAGIGMFMAFYWGVDLCKPDDLFL